MSLQAALDAEKHLNHVALIENLTQLSLVAQGRYSRLAALLAQQRIDSEQYATKTSLVSEELKNVDVIHIRRVMEMETISEDPEQDRFAMLDFEHSGISLFIVVLLVLSFLVLLFWCCKSHKSPSARGVHIETGHVVVNPIVERMKSSRA